MDLDVEIEEVENPFSNKLPLCVIARSNSGITSLGKGVDYDSRLISAFGETLERLIMQSVKPSLVAKYDQSLNKVNPDLFYPEFNVDEDVEWLRCVNQNNNEYYLHRPIRNSEIKKYFDHTSSGCSVGASIDDVKERALNEILERHYFLSFWYFNNISKKEISVNSNNLIKLIQKVGWKPYAFELTNNSNSQLTVVLLENKSDSRFQIGGGVIGCSYGLNANIDDAVAEGIQALEVFLLNGIKDPCIKYYLEMSNGAAFLKSILNRPKSHTKEILLGDIYFYIKETQSEIPFYAEAFVEGSLPIQLGLKVVTKRVPPELAEKITDYALKHPIPLG